MQTMMYHIIKLCDLMMIRFYSDAHGGVSSVWHGDIGIPSKKDCEFCFIF